MKEDEKATGGYVIAGKPYIIGDGDGDWDASMIPKKPKKALEITNEIYANIKEDELIKAERELIRALIWKAIKEL